MSAYVELMETLRENEIVEAVYFGEHSDFEGKYYSDIDIPPHHLYTSISLVEAIPYLKKWDSFDKEYGEQCNHEFYAWTNERIFYIQEYDTSTYLVSQPRHPLKNIEVDKQ